MGRESPDVSAIYALCDPDSNAVRYIGKTTCPLKERLAQHMAEARRYEGNVPVNMSAKNEWIRSLESTGKRPTILLIESTSDYEAGWDIERRWIDFYRGEVSDLLNGNSGVA